MELDYPNSFRDKLRAELRVKAAGIDSNSFLGNV